MGGVSKEQIARAKAVSLLDYLLSHEGGNFKRVGNAYYRRDPDHNSLEVSNNLWHWHSHGIGGDIIDYLVKIEGYSFVDAVRRLAGDDFSIPAVPKARPPNTVKQSERERKRFTPPPRNSNNARVIAYLQSRGISKPLIQECIANGSLYESASYHNACFIGRDENGKARFAALRGTLGSFKRDADGSDKRFGFCLPPMNGNSDTVMAFESPIDALSHACLFPDTDGYRLSLGGTSLSALAHFLETHGEIKAIVVCTDDDEVGNLAAARIAEFGGYHVTRQCPVGKDFNEQLLKQQKAERLQGRFRTENTISL